MRKVKVEFDADKAPFFTAEDMFMLTAVVKEFIEASKIEAKEGTYSKTEIENNIIPWGEHALKVTNTMINQAGLLNRRGLNMRTDKVRICELEGIVYDKNDSWVCLYCNE